MFEDITASLEKYEEFSEKIDLVDYELYAKKNARELARIVLHKKLRQNALHAVNSIQEYKDCPSLQERFLENINNPEHIYISPEMTYATVFNEEIAGSYSDLIEGQEAAGGRSTKPQAAMIWKYGIYLPHAIGTHIISFHGKLPDYEEIIDRRLSFWGDKAPYWYFIAYGNLGLGDAYPSFSGIDFISETEEFIQPVLEHSINKAIEEITLELDDLVNDIIFKETLLSNIVMYSVPIENVVNYSIETRRSKHAGVWYMLKHSGRYEKKIEIGDILPGGEIFRG